MKIKDMFLGLAFMGGIMGLLNLCGAVATWLTPVLERAVLG